MNNKIKCPICSNVNIFKKEDKNNYFDLTIQSPEHYSIFTCAKCLAEFAWPRQSQNYENVSTEFKGYKSFINKKEFDGQIYHTINCTSHWKDSSIIYNILSTLNFRGEFLDFAAGSGYITALAHRLGYNVHALEINSDFQRFIKEMIPSAIIHESLDGLILSNKKFDVINAMHILEHLPDPIDVLNKLHSLLSQHGILIVAVPNLDRAYYRFGERGKEIEDQIESLGFAGDFPPNHLTRFRSKTMSIALENSGFKRNAISYSPVSIWDLFHYGLGDKRFKFSDYSSDPRKMSFISALEERLNEMFSYLCLEDLGTSLIAISSDEMEQNVMADLLTQGRIRVMDIYTNMIQKQYDQFMLDETNKDEMLKEKDRYIESLKEQILKKEKESFEKDRYIEEKDRYIESLKEHIFEKEKDTFEKDRYIESLKEHILEKEKQIHLLKKP